MTAQGILTDAGDLARIASVLDRLPQSWQGIQTRADVFAALEAAALDRDEHARRSTWEKIRYLAGWPTGTGVRMPLYAAMQGGAGRDPYTDGEPPEFCELLAKLNSAAGWEG